MRPFLFRVSFLFVVFFVGIGVGQSQNIDSAQVSENNVMRELNQKVASQAEQLAAQQAQIKALQDSMDEQRSLLLRLLNASAESKSTPPAPAPPPLHSAVESASLSISPTSSATPPPPSTSTSAASAVVVPSRNPVEQPNGGEKHWYEKYSLRGYVQMRDNGIFASNDDYRCE